jgi:DNA-binding transcriptional MerR regulator
MKTSYKMDNTAKSDSAFRTISEVADELGVQQHVLRFWETKFIQVKPLKRGGGRRYYRPEDVALLKKIHTLLYSEGYTIKGVQKLLKGVSKTQVLQEQKKAGASSTTHAYGENMPQVQGPDLPPTVHQEEPPVLAPASTLSEDQAVLLRSVLAELEEMREELRRLSGNEALAA